MVFFPYKTLFFQSSETKFKNIPRSLWWAIVTMTTVGYGDMSPETTLGMILGSIAASMSVVLLALPVSIIGTYTNFHGKTFVSEGHFD